VNEPVREPGASGDGADGGGAMFDRIAHRYDAMNRILSLGIDRRWRRRAVAAIGDADLVLDLATGTGDLALAILRARGTARVVGVDPSPAMLARARAKADRAGAGDRLELMVGVGEDLPLEDRRFDACAVAFGIRNAADRPRALAEMVRVTRPGGRIVVLELSEPRGALGPLARFHVHRVVPALGALLSGAREYRYLERSIAAFPPPADFAALLAAAGATRVEIVPLTFGACHIYAGEVRG
jgi:demethylmenaquinone methyltransferase / 2-methoxy-6-polyprenyl-1,4-benzoquinol methylase